MKVYKETEIKYPLFAATLDNGVKICVYDGYAEGDDGRIYKPVMKEIDDDELEFFGWRVACDIH